MNTTQQIQVTRQTQRQPPVRRFNSGEVQVAVWENLTTMGTVVHKATVSRRYRGHDGAWRSTASFRKQDLRDLISALEQALEEMPE